MGDDWVRKVVPSRMELRFLEEEARDFPGSPVVKVPCSQCREHGFSAWLGN